MRHRALLMLTAALFLLTTAQFAESPSDQHNRHHQLVSLIRVIASPNNFNGQPVRVIGFVARGGGTDRAVGLFISEIDGRNSITPNSIDLRVEEPMVKDLMRKYAVVSGTYHAPDPRADYNGYIDSVLDIKALGAEEGSR
jgi:hypothetical protein